MKCRACGDTSDLGEPFNMPDDVDGATGEVSYVRACRCYCGELTEVHA